MQFTQLVPLRLGLRVTARGDNKIVNPQASAFLNSTCASVGWLAAAALGGWILATVGFVGFGPLVAVLSLLGASVALLGPRPTRPV